MKPEKLKKTSKIKKLRKRFKTDFCKKKKRIKFNALYQAKRNSRLDNDIGQVYPIKSNIDTIMLYQQTPMEKQSYLQISI